MKNIDPAILVPKFDAILSRGLCTGLGVRGEQECIEAAVCEVLGLPHGDNPEEYVSAAVRSYKIALNDVASWSSPHARAAGLRDLGLAQIGSRGVVDDLEFSRRLAEQHIRVLIPALFRELFPNQKALLDAAKLCEAEGTHKAAYAARAAADVAAYAARAAAAYAADVAGAAAYAAGAADRYLRLSASIALQVLIDLKSPGTAWIATNAVAKLRAR